MQVIVTGLFISLFIEDSFHVIGVDLPLNES
jgi:hypothetical protein